jgi:hypothetical protein
VSVDVSGVLRTARLLKGDALDKSLTLGHVQASLHGSRLIAIFSVCTRHLIVNNCHYFEINRHIFEINRHLLHY